MSLHRSGTNTSARALLVLAAAASWLLFSCEKHSSERARSGGPSGTTCASYLACVRQCSGPLTGECVETCRRAADPKAVEAAWELAACEGMRCSQVDREYRHEEEIDLAADPAVLARQGHAVWVACSRERCRKERALCGLDME